MTEEKLTSTRKLINDLITRMTEEEDSALVQTALTMTVHFFCGATECTQEDFIKGLMHLKQESEK